MKPLSVLGLVLVLIGIISLAYGGLSYTSKDKVIDAGPIQISADKKHGVAVPPLVGGAILLAGAALLVLGRKKA